MPGENLIQIGSQGREMQIAFEATSKLVSTEKFLVPYVLEGEASMAGAGFLRPKRTSVQAPWQNGTAERWVGSCRREILDHVIALNEPHLRRLIRDYVSTRPSPCV
jgi:hypothetical protein